MLSESDRKHAAQLLLTAEADRKPVRQLSKTWPDITIEDACAIQASRSFTGPVWARNGDTIHGDFGPLGDVSAHFI